LARFKNAVATYPRLTPLVKSLRQNFQNWHSAITTNPAAFGDSFKSLRPAGRGYLLGQIEKKIDRLARVLEQEGKLVDAGKWQKDAQVSTEPNDGLVAAWQDSYDWLNNDPDYDD
jgi:hypothetical protein